MQVAVQRAQVHVLEDDQRGLGLRLRADADEADDVGVVELRHDGRLLQELALVLFRGGCG